MTIIKILSGLLVEENEEEVDAAAEDIRPTTIKIKQNSHLQCTSDQPETLKGKTVNDQQSHSRQYHNLHKRNK